MAAGVVVPPVVVAGYVVADVTRRPSGFDAGVPDPFLTISECLADGLVTPAFSGWFQDEGEARASNRAASTSPLLFVVALTPDDAAGFMRELDDEPWHFDLLRRGQSPPADTDWRGFEIVGAEDSLSLHSWHCHSYAPDVASELGVTLNRDGLLGEYGDAMRVRRWMLELPQEQQPKPVPWAVVALGVLPA